MAGRWAVLMMLAFAAACGDESSKSDAGAEDAQVVSGPYDTCQVDSDCAWTEIEHEITRRKDCPCLFGCPYLPLAKEAVDRRANAYASLCERHRDGNGNECGIDDCVIPPAIACVQGKCRAASAAAAP